MRLFNINEDVIEAYEMTPRIKEIEEYKRKEMANIPLDRRVLYARTFDDDEKVLENKKNIIRFQEIMSLPSNGTHSISSCNMEESEKLELLEEYYFKSLIFQPVVEVSVDCLNQSIFGIKNDFLYLLLTSKEYEEKYTPRPVYEMPGIISITRPLHLLQLILNEEYTRLNDKDISEQLSLFDISDKVIETIPINPIKKLRNNGLYSDEEYDKLMQKIEGTQMVLKKANRI